MKLLIEKIFRSKTNEDGSPRMNKYGKPYTLVNVYHEGKRYTAFDDEAETFTGGWNEGMEIDVNVKEESYKGVISYRIEKPSRFSELEKRIETIEKGMSVFKKAIQVLQDRAMKESGLDKEYKPPEYHDEVDTDLPFD